MNTNVYRVSVAMLVTAFVIVATGCAAPARVDRMQAELSPEQRIQASPLQGRISVRDVTGGKETNPMWTSEVSSHAFRNALEQSLREANLFAPGPLGDYHLVAHMESLNQPLLGANMTVTAAVQYTLFEKDTGAHIYDQRIVSPYTASWNASLIGSERLRIANEGAIRENIQRLVGDLMKLDP